MEQDLFANVDKNIQSDFYKEMLARRTRPDLHEEGVDAPVQEPGAGYLMQGRELQSYPYERVLEESTRYFKGDTLAANVWINKYALKDSSNNLYELTPDDMHWRLAREIARMKRFIIYSRISGSSSPRAVPWRESEMISRSPPCRIAL